MNSASVSRCRFLLHFANEHLDFRLPELHSVAEILGIPLKIKEYERQTKSPFLIVEVPSEDNVKQLLKRTILVRSAYELWAEGKTLESLNERLAKLSPEITEPYTSADSTFKIVVEAFNKKIPPKEKLEKIESLPWTELGLKGKIRLENPDHSFYLLEFYEDETGSHSALKPSSLYFGRFIAEGSRDQIRHYHLQNRCFIGNTSMDAGLSLIMANMGKAAKNKLVFDPFVGTGSLLVACAHFGSYVMGADLDYLLLHGKARPSRHNQKTRDSNESIRSNLIQYGVGHLYIDAIIADSSKHKLWRKNEIFDAIITDPPYGIREPAKKISPNNRRAQSPERCQNHLPLKTHYQLSDIFKDLLNFAAKHLVLNGRLVYWFPVYRSEYQDENVPIHPNLELVANSEQPLSTKVGRRLITMEKIKSYQENSEDSGSASVILDHYAKSTFRQKYFESY
ncbi:tRNA (guanine(10)-N2)-methyltransferase homolog [Octopus bimaculoides]|uniref:tRNA (guanine(10)-N(2))-methyltransferase TRMT11 n=1 Tax=Octopus bimaculoides TaxID=37653 RepID=A0A0L8GDZ2_OCTBM|nr:tRNA (guanine(10)-N2)-methyltransferase homolog [Octopus bimaculoides]|eukprot:XP_014781948.1 PREDICTED: tRNA (guanine(10)-N2)-methyltransferase homolog [Octopus bimaculoides]